MIDIPLIGLGTWDLRSKGGYEAMRFALEIGYRHLDTATMYRNEAEVGRAVRDSGIDRSEVFVTTKLPAGSAGRERETIESSLRALGMEYVDLWLIHWPPHGGAAPQTWKAFIDVATEGLTRRIGVSNYSTAQIDELIQATGRTPDVNQIEWSPFIYDPQREEEHRARGIVLEGYSPFKSSNLRHPVLREVATNNGMTPAQAVLRWHIEHGVVAIPKSDSPDRLRENLAVLQLELSPADKVRLDGLGGNRGRRRWG